MAKSGISKTVPLDSIVAQVVKTTAIVSHTSTSKVNIIPMPASTKEKNLPKVTTSQVQLPPQPSTSTVNDAGATVTPKGNQTSAVEAACKSLACLNNGRCEVGSSGAFCTCAEGFSGEFCGVNRGASIGDTNKGVADWIVALAVVACVLFLAFIALVIVLTNRRRRSYSPQAKDLSAEEAKAEEVDDGSPGPSSAIPPEEKEPSENEVDGTDNPVYENID